MGGRFAPFCRGDTPRNAPIKTIFHRSVIFTGLPRSFRINYKPHFSLYTVNYTLFSPFALISFIVFMNNTFMELIGSLAGALTTISFLPQVIKTYRSRCAKGLSLGMFLLFTLGILMWLIYGIGINKPPIIVANSITLVMAAMLLFAKFKF